MGESDASRTRPFSMRKCYAVFACMAAFGACLIASELSDPIMYIGGAFTVISIAGILTWPLGDGDW